MSSGIKLDIANGDVKGIEKEQKSNALVCVHELPCEHLTEEYICSESQKHPYKGCPKHYWKAVQEGPIIQIIIEAEYYMSLKKKNKQ